MKIVKLTKEESDQAEAVSVEVSLAIDAENAAMDRRRTAEEAHAAFLVHLAQKYELDRASLSDDFQNAIGYALRPKSIAKAG